MNFESGRDGEKKMREMDIKYACARGSKDETQFVRTEAKSRGQAKSSKNRLPEKSGVTTAIAHILTARQAKSR